MRVVCMRLVVHCCGVGMHLCACFVLVLCLLGFCMLPDCLVHAFREDGYPVMAAKGALDKGWQELT